MDIVRKRERLSGFLKYILGRNPSEFGIVVNDEGFIKIKEVLSILSEEDGWGFVRQHSITELLITMPEPGIEISGDLIRAVNREKLFKPVYNDDIPKLLFIGIKKSAYFHIFEQGIKPYDNKTHVILSSNRDMADRIAKRRDVDPVILTVNTHEAEQSGVMFLYAGETIFLAKEIPVNCFNGPLLPAQNSEKERHSRKKPQSIKAPPEPGSFFPVFNNQSRDRRKIASKNEKTSWKNNKKKLRKQKEQYREF